MIKCRIIVRRRGGKAAFDALAGLSTDSMFLNRLIDWGMSREAHQLLEYSEFFALDEQASDAAAWEEYALVGFDDPVPEGVKYQLSKEGKAWLHKHPEDTALLLYGLQKINEDPTFGDGDYYAPDPFRGMANGDKSHVSLRGAEQELAIETIHLFGLREIDDVSEPARAQLFRVGVNLDDATYDQISLVVENMDVTKKRMFAEAFIATEFGDDFGDMILDIAESGEHEGVFQSLETIRSSAAQLAEQYDNDIEGFKEAYTTSWTKRTTELLATVADREASTEDTQAAIDTLAIIAYAAETDAAATQSGFRLTNAGEMVGHATLRSADERLTKTIRPTGGAPRVGDTVKIPAQLIPAAANGKDKRLSIRLDYDENGLSLDIGSSGKGVNSSGVGQFVAQQLAKGELRLFARRQLGRIERANMHAPTEATLHGNHVREAFAGLDKIDERRFAELVVDHVDTLTLTS